MEQKPKISIKLLFTDKIIELLALIVFLSIWFLALSGYSQLPETIPTHYNGFGKADAFGNKANILVLPIVASVLAIALTAINFYPHLLNYTVAITQENAEKQYRLATRMLRCLKLIVLIIFTFIVYMTQQTSKGIADGLGEWILPTILGLIFIPIFYFLTQMSKNS
ncbi:hypothetical protein FEDK69T_10500 [Flavobacterium enshiense DK69]|uniref:DUF1648 domain-containing protein n=1 Tax=Flavobacterium enshiense DK69 TaxID=1107311 RepID=V6SHU9_9FLAO|nr:DUF1648 domain-containing protein [Flavobacterium enshiense]ESU23990.1 hypothetical protein FEDK69T_10500 [Flavobacterium enshiense DK69]KGO96220.1 hypothetical protein Q767_08185 [Flavobacterium enshiense DK69]